MRKNDVRKWIHATLDMLPLLVIPVFMVYSHRHTIDSYSVTRLEAENITYNLSQEVFNGKPSGDNNIDFALADGTFEVHDYIECYNVEDGDYIDFSCNFPYVSSHKYFISFDISNESIDDVVLSINLADIDGANEVEVFYDTINVTSFTNYSFIKDSIGTFDVEIVDFYFFSSCDFSLKNVEIFDLTIIFGSGNEPSLSECQNIFTLDYYDYGVNYPYVVEGVPVSVTYDDTDIGSQFTYALYNTVDKYFNFGNVLGFGNIYDWLKFNIFNGVPPLAVDIVWNVFLYEFLMDLIFLLYALFMFFIDMCTNLIDRFTLQASGRR